MRLLLATLRVYQRVFSPLMPAACRFYPTCSHYAYEAIELHGARRGAWLALKRLLRCQPFSQGGLDPVPQPNSLPRHTRVVSDAMGVRR
jgi:putative membrane protein insertion efficiency factor